MESKYIRQLANRNGVSVWMKKKIKEELDELERLATIGKKYQWIDEAEEKEPDEFHEFACYSCPKDFDLIDGIEVLGERCSEANCKMCWENATRRT